MRGRCRVVPGSQPGPAQAENVCRKSTCLRALAKAGKQLAKLHLEYESLKPWPLKWIETPGVPLSYRVEKIRLGKDKTSIEVVLLHLGRPLDWGGCGGYNLGVEHARRLSGGAGGGAGC